MAEYPFQAALDAMIKAKQQPPESAYWAQALGTGATAYQARQTAEQVRMDKLKSDIMSYIQTLGSRGYEPVTQEPVMNPAQGQTAGQMVDRPVEPFNLFQSIQKTANVPPGVTFQKSQTPVDMEGLYLAGISPTGKPYYRSYNDLISVNPVTSQAVNLSKGGAPVTGRLGASRIVSGTPIDTKNQIIASKDLQTYASDANQALTAIDKIEKYANILGDFDKGIVQQYISKGIVKYRELSADPQVSQYIGVVSQELIPMARKIMEEKGPITEFDVTRVEKGLGNITLPLDQKINLLNELRNKIKQAVELKAGLAGITDINNSAYANIYRKANNRSGTGYSATQSPNTTIPKSDPMGLFK